MTAARLESPPFQHDLTRVSGRDEKVTERCPVTLLFDLESALAAVRDGSGCAKMKAAKFRRVKI